MHRTGRRLVVFNTVVVAVLALARVASAQVVTTRSGENLGVLRQAVFSGLQNQIGTLPIPAGGGFTYEFDPTLGIFTRSTSSLGPIFGERAETTGRNRITLNTSYTAHSYDRLDGVDLHGGELQAITEVSVAGLTRFSLRNVEEDVHADVFTLGATYGVTDRLDVGLTIPIVRVGVTENVRRVGFRDCDTGTTRCDPFVDQSGGNFRSLPGSATNSGLGDLDLRAKYNLLSVPNVLGGKVGLAAALNVKLPTGDDGDQRQFERAQLILGPQQLVSDSFFELGDPPLGTGIVRVKPQVIVSGAWGWLAAHASFGAELGTTSGITNDLIYTAGLEVTPASAVTVAFDVLGRYSFDVTRRRAQGTLGEAGVNARIVEAAGGPPVVVATADEHTMTASVGLKINPVRTLILFVNFLIPLDDGNLRDNLTPTIGLEWSF